jgi:phenylacetic acid degradation operon negative regulatory protein
VDVATSQPALSRRHEAGAGSARGLLFTLLGELVLPSEEAAWTGAVLAAFARLGIAEKAARQALMRTANAGWLQPEKVGRRTRWRLTPAARKLLTDGARRIYSFGPAAEWDGQWVLAQVRIPESDRSARHEVRTRLAWAGFGSLGPSLWISPHANREPEAIRVLTEAGVAADAHVFVARRTGLSAPAQSAPAQSDTAQSDTAQSDTAQSDTGPGRAVLAGTRAMVASAWDLPAIEAEYEQFVDAFGASETPHDVLVRQLELVHAWRRFPALDPSLPRELLPPRWTGIAAAELFADRRQRWLPDARREWQRLNSLA